MMSIIKFFQFIEQRKHNQMHQLMSKIQKSKALQDFTNRFMAQHYNWKQCSALIPTSCSSQHLFDSRPCTFNQTQPSQPYQTSLCQENQFLTLALGQRHQQKYPSDDQSIMLVKNRQLSPMNTQEELFNDPSTKIVTQSKVTQTSLYHNLSSIEQKVVNGVLVRFEVGKKTLNEVTIKNGVSFQEILIKIQTAKKKTLTQKGIQKILQRVKQHYKPHLAIQGCRNSHKTVIGKQGKQNSYTEKYCISGKTNKKDKQKLMKTYREGNYSINV